MERIQRIVWYHPMLRVNGGGERLILEGLQAFENHGLDATLLVAKSQKTELYDGVYKPRIVVLGLQDGGALRRVLRRVSPLLATAWLLRKELRRLQPDLVIAQAQWGEAIPLYLATAFTPFKYAAYIFDSLFTYKGERSRHALVFRRHFREVRNSVPSYRETTPASPPRLSAKKRFWLEVNGYLRYLSVRKAELIIVFSSQNKWEVEKLYGKRAFATKGAFRPAIFSHQHKENIKQNLGINEKTMILSVCRLIDKKRIDLCIRAFKELSEKYADTVLVVGGQGKEESNLKKLTEKIGLGSKVLFVGHVKEEELWNYYSSADLFVHMDLADFDIAPYEALALGTKVVWSSEMEVDENLVGNESLFVAEPTVRDLAETMDRALNAKCAGTTVSALSGYTWDKYFARVLDELNRTLNCRRGNYSPNWRRSSAASDAIEGVR